MSTSSLEELGRLGQVFELHRGQLLAMLERRMDAQLKRLTDPENILQEAFLRAQQRWPDYLAMSPRPKEYVWLYGQARDVLHETWRRHHAQVRDADRDVPYPDHSSVQLGLGIIGRFTSPSGKAMRAELQACMRQTLELLKPQEREVLWMRHADQLTFGDVASVLAITENAATVRYVRALRKLKSLWLQLHGDKGFEL